MATPKFNSEEGNSGLHMGCSVAIKWMLQDKLWIVIQGLFACEDYRTTHFRVAQTLLHSNK